MPEFNITFFEACEILNRSRKTISRYIRRGLLTPLEIKSKQGTTEYRFNREQLEALRERLAQKQARQDISDETGQMGQMRQDTLNNSMLLQNKEIQKQMGQMRQDRTDETGQARQDTFNPENPVIALLKETTELLKQQLSIKDSQINTLNEQVHKLIERDRETNILLKNLQDKLLMLEAPKKEVIIETRQDKTGQRAERIRQIILLTLLLIVLFFYFYLNLLPLIKLLILK